MTINRQFDKRLKNDWRPEKHFFIAVFQKDLPSVGHFETELRYAIIATVKIQLFAYSREQLLSILQAFVQFLSIILLGTDYWVTKVVCRMTPHGLLHYLYPS